ncbi:hypothetical protein KY342_02480 [Candidatus Woesearchaeota archaeon]|nr:hypothetical protein [Candidatus Woesearchaeota archaeon]
MDKAQIFSLDAIIAAGIFILILLSAALIWNYSREKISIEETRNDMEIIARNALSVLIETKGNPKNWTSYTFNQINIHSIGLAEEFLILNQTKINSLSSADYSTAKTILGILGSNYEFRLNIDTWNGTSYMPNYTIGTAPNATASEVVNIERFALLDNLWAKTTMKLWKSCEDATC